MRRSTDRILTTHVGSLARPHNLLDTMKEREYGRPYDHDYGDTRYAREDTKMALRQVRASGITPFCITIEREGEDQLKDMYGEVGYTIIDNVLSLPERLPGIYRRLTT